MMKDYPTTDRAQALTYLHSPPIIRDDGRAVMRCQPRRRAYLYQSAADLDKVTCPRCKTKAQRKVDRAAARSASRC